MTIQELATHIRVLEDERAILRVLHDYGSMIDYGEAASWLDLFTPDARLELSYRTELQPTHYGDPQETGNELVYAGHAMLASFIGAHTHAPGAYHKHVVTGARIDLQGDTARCESYFLRIDERDLHPVIVAAGRYRDTLARSADGRWRFSVRRAEIEARLATR